MYVYIYICIICIYIYMYTYNRRLKGITGRPPGDHHSPRTQRHNNLLSIALVAVPTIAPGGLWVFFFVNITVLHYYNVILLLLLLLWSS